MRRALSAALTVAACAAALTGGVTGSAYAAGPSGAETCPDGTICLYYNSPNNEWGSFEHFTVDAGNYLDNYYFRDWGNGSGYGQTVYKNAASVVNNTPVEWEICYSVTPSVGCVPIPSQYSGRLPDAVYNKDVAFYPN
jgi:hypothetical protein